MAVLRKKDLRKMSNEELEKKLDELRRELLSIKGKVRAHIAPDNPGRIRELRRSIARILTLLRERGIER